MKDKLIIQSGTEYINILIQNRHTDTSKCISASSQILKNLLVLKLKLDEVRIKVSKAANVVKYSTSV